MPGAFAVVEAKRTTLHLIYLILVCDRPTIHFVSISTDIIVFPVLTLFCRVNLPVLHGAILTLAISTLQLLASADSGLAAWRQALRLDAVLARRTVCRLVR